MRPRLPASATTAVLAPLCAGLILIAPAGSPERVIAALLLVLVLPGWALSQLLPAGDATAAGSAFLIPALSITTAILDAAVLNALGLRLDLDSWAWSLTVVTILADTATWLWRRPATGAARLPRHAPAPLLVAAMGAAGLLLAGATMVTVRSVQIRQQNDRFTQLWAIPASGARNRVTVGIYNHQGVSERYILRVRGDGRLLRTETVPVAPGHTWTMSQLRPAATARLRVSVTSSPGSRYLYRWVALGYRVQMAARLRLLGCRPVRVRVNSFTAAATRRYVLVMSLPGASRKILGSVRPGAGATVTTKLRLAARSPALLLQLRAGRGTGRVLARLTRKCPS